MRGKGPQLKACTFFTGITPAYAGKSNQNYSNVVQLEDHPRLCGEKRKILRQIHTVQGSPPPMRGKGHCIVFRWIYLGITPAYAGKRDTSVGGKTNYEDHPRLCGEKV